MKAHVFIYGKIGYEGSDGVILLDVISQMKKANDADTIMLHISSPGGKFEVARAIRDYIRTIKETKTVIAIGEGQVASAATLIYLDCDLRAAREDFEFMIHNPWGGVQGDADYIESYAKEVRDIEKELIEEYSTKLNIDAGIIAGLMKDETYLGYKRCNDLVIINYVIEQETVMAIAEINNFKNDKKMTSEDKTFFEQLREDFKALGKDIKEAFKTSIKALTLMSKEGVEIVFPTDTPAVGDKVAVADGTYTIEYAEKMWTVVVVSEEVTELTEVAEEPANPDVEALKAENASLKAELESMKAVKDEIVNLKKIVNEARKAKTAQPGTPDPGKFQEPKPDPIEARKQELREKAAKVSKTNL